MAGQGKIYTKKSIAQILELTEKRVEQLAKEGIIEEYSRGHFKLLPTLQGYINYLRSQMSGGADYNTEKAELTRLKREDAELDLQLKRNELTYDRIASDDWKSFIKTFAKDTHDIGKQRR